MVTLKDCKILDNWAMLLVRGEGGRGPASGHRGNLEGFQCSASPGAVGPQPWS